MKVTLPIFSWPSAIAGITDAAIKAAVNKRIKHFFINVPLKENY